MANIIEIIIRATDNASAVLKGTGTDLKKLGTDMTKIGAGMSLALTAPILALGKSSIEAASNLEESLNKANVVFGESAGVIESWAETAAASFGQSKRQALEAAGTFGNLFSAMGMGQDEAAGMSTKLVELASDLASFNNIDPAVALDKLRAGLVGEAEPLKTLGVLINESTVKAKAMELGLGDASGALTEAEKVQARYALILEQTGKAQGDFARTADGLANSQRTLNATWEDTKAKLGEALLPIALQLSNALLGLLTAFNNLSPGAQQTILVIGGLLAVAGPLLMIVGQIIAVVGALGPVFATVSTAIGGAGPVLAGVAAVITGPVLLAIAALAAGIALLYIGWQQNWFGIRDSFNLVIDNIKAVWQAFLLILQGDWAGAGEVLKASFSKTWEEIKSRFEAVKTTLANIAKAVGGSIVSGLVDGVKSAASKLIEAVKGVVNSALDAAKALLGISSPSSVFAQIGQQMMTGMAQGIRGGTMQPVGAMAYAVPQLMGAASGGINVTMHNNIGSNIDIEVMAQRVAQIIQRRRR